MKPGNILGFLIWSTKENLKDIKYPWTCSEFKFSRNTHQDKSLSIFFLKNNLRNSNHIQEDKNFVLSIPNIIFIESYILKNEYRI